MLACQRADGTALLNHGLSPSASVLANQPGAIQKVIQALLDDAVVGRVQMVRIGGELPRLGEHIWCATL